MQRRYYLTSIICIILSACFMGLGIWLRLPHASENLEEFKPEPPASSSEQPPEVDPPEEPPYQSPIDFEGLQKINSDSYAWLEIPGTEVSYVVGQSQTDDTLYIRHDINKKYSISGTLFTEHKFNGRDFGDKVTIIYGHRMKDNTMFGPLQEVYSDPETFASHNKIVVYLPDRELHYTVFAAVPYSKKHIMYQYKAFEQAGSLKRFLEKIDQTRGFGTCFDRTVSVEDSDQVLILSTCLKGNNQKRYLVLAKLTEEIA